MKPLTVIISSETMILGWNNYICLASVIILIHYSLNERHQVINMLRESFSLYTLLDYFQYFTELVGCVSACFLLQD